MAAFATPDEVQRRRRRQKQGMGTPPLPQPAGGAAPATTGATAAPVQQQRPQRQGSPLTGQVNRFLGQNLQGGLGNDPFSQALVADFDADAERQRKQQIEDLQRFGVIGGNGASAGATADVLGAFDAAVLRGRNAAKATGQQNLLNSILPAAIGQSQFGDTMAQQGRQFEANQGLLNRQLDQQGSQFDAGLALDQQRVNNQASQFGAGQALTREQAGLARKQQLALQSNELGFGREQLTEQQRQANQADALARSLQQGQLGFGREQLTETGRQYDAGLALDNRRLAQQGSQFDDTIGLDRDRLTETGRQFDQTQGLRNLEFSEGRRQFNESQDFAGDQANLDRALQQTVADRQHEIARAGLTGQIRMPTEYTGQAPELVNTLARDQLNQQNRLQEASLTGRLDGTTPTLAREAQALQRGALTGELADGTQTLAAQQQADAQRLAEAGLTGQLDGDATLAQQALTQQATLADADRSLQQRLAEAGLTGRLDGNATVAEKARLEQERVNEENRRGVYFDPTTGQYKNTLAGRGLDLEQQRVDNQGNQFDDALALQRAGLSGTLDDGNQTLAAQQIANEQGYRDDQLDLARAELSGKMLNPLTGMPTDTLAAKQIANQDALQRAGLTGDLGGTQTLAAKALAQDDSQFQDSLGIQRDQVSNAETARQDALRLAEMEMFGAEQIGLTLDADAPMSQRLAQFDRIRNTLGREPTEAEVQNLLAGGTIDGRQTLAAKQAGEGNALARAGLTGTLDGDDTLAKQALTSDQGFRNDQLDLQKSELSGRMINPLTGMPTDTLAKQALTGDQSFRDDQLEEARLARTQAGDLAKAELSGRMINPLTGMPMDTLAKQGMTDDQNFREALALGKLNGQDTLDRERLTQQGDQFDDTLGLQKSELSGRMINPLTGMPTDTLAKQQLTQQGNQFDDEIALREALALGKVNDQETLDTKRFNEATSQFDDTLGLQKAELSGKMINPLTGMPTDTLAARQLSQQDTQFDDDLTFRKGLAKGSVDGDSTLDAQQSLFNQGIVEAGLTGTYKDNPTLQKLLADADLTGNYGDDRTLAGQSLDEQVRQADLGQGNFDKAFDAEQRQNASRNDIDRLNAALGFQQAGVDLGGVDLPARLAQLLNLNNVGPGGNEFAGDALGRADEISRNIADLEKQLDDAPGGRRSTGQRGIIEDKIKREKENLENARKLAAGDAELLKQAEALAGLKSSFDYTGNATASPPNPYGTDGRQTVPPSGAAKAAAPVNNSIAVTADALKANYGVNAATLGAVAGNDTAAMVRFILQKGQAMNPAFSEDDAVAIRKQLIGR